MSTQPAEKARMNGVLFLRDSSLDWYIPQFSKSVYTLQIPPEVYKDMEIINHEAYIKLVNDFFTVNSFPPLDLHIIMQGPFLKKEFALLPQAQMDAVIQTYLDYVPFDTVISKRLKSEKGTIVIVANGDFIDSVKSMLLHLNCNVDCVAPIDGLPFFPPGGLSVFTESMGQTVMKNLAQVKQESFQVVVQKESDEFEVVDIPDKPLQPASQLPLLLGVFGLLLVILAAVWINMGKDFGLTPKPVRRKTIIPTQVPKPTAAVKGVFTSFFPSVTIVTTEPQATAATELSQALAASGYRQVSVTKANAPPNPRTVIMVPSTIDLELLEDLKLKVLTVSRSIAVDRTTTPENTVTVVLGNLK